MATLSICSFEAKICLLSPRPAIYPGYEALPPRAMWCHCLSCAYRVVCGADRGVLRECPPSGPFGKYRRGHPSLLHALLYALCFCILLFVP